MLQLITGATGLDDWEWGVTLFADEPTVIKDIVYEMGLLHDAMGQTAKAVERFKEIYAVDIRYKDVAQRIEQAYKR